MRQYQQIFENSGGPTSRFDIVIEWLIIILLAFMPLAFGVVHAWSEEIVLGLAGVIVLCFLLKLVFHQNQRLIWTWAYIPVGLFFIIALIQLVPMPVRIVSIISPNTVNIRNELLSDLLSANKLLKSMPLTLYPYATKHALRLLLAITGVFVVVLNVFRRPDQIKRLLMAISVIGGIVATITLAQNLFGNGKIYWFINSDNCKGFSGPFVNHSNYGQFMNLSIGAALGLFMVKLREAFVGNKITPPNVLKYLSSKSAYSLWLMVAIISVGTTTVFVSLTRGGMVSMIIAITFTTLLITSRRSKQVPIWIMVILALGAFTCVLYTGFDAVYDRLATLRNFHEAEAGRLQILKDIAVIWTKFPALGTGFGTHSVVYPMFDRSTITALAMHAENEYAQVLEETGLIGLILLIIFAVIVWSNYVKTIHNTKSPICPAAYGLGFGILAIMTHSLSDFGQHLPANAVLSAIFCALLLGLSQHRHTTRPEQKNTERYKVLSSYAILIAAPLFWIWVLTGADDARIAESHWKKALDIEKGLKENNWQGSESEYADLISHAKTALDYQPENVKYRHWLNVYRWHSISKTTDPNTGQTTISKDSTTIVRDIVEELHKARVLCPTYGPPYTVAGQIEKYCLNIDSGSDRIRKGFCLAPCDPVACFVAGCLDISEGKNEQCIEKLQRAVQLDGNLFKEIANIYINYLSRPDLALAIADSNIDRLTYVAGILEDMQYYDLAKQTSQEIQNLLEEECSKLNAPASAFVSLANIYIKQQDNKAAIECYRRALALNYSQVQWRLTLARLLAETENIPEAIQQARICLRVRPQSKEAENLIADFAVHPAVVKEEIESP